MKNYLSELKKLKPYSMVIAAGTFLALILLLFFSVAFRNYTSTVTVLVNTKSQSASLNQEKILNNIAEFPKTLNFYQRLLNDNPQIKETKAASSASEKKENWNKMVSVKRSPKNSSLIKISITADNEKDAEKLSIKTARTLFDTASSYYNVKTDVDMRLVDGPITKTSIKYWPWLLIASVILGYLLAYFLYVLIKPLSKNISAAADVINEKMQQFNDSLEALKNSKAEKKEDVQQQKQGDAMSEKESPKVNTEKPTEVTQKDQELERLNKIIQQDIYPNFPEMPVTAARKSSAPDNLPIGDSSFFMEENPKNETISESEELETEKKVEEDPKREPTPEELKKRLNQLLKG